MPVSSIMKLPKTESAEEFEKICIDILKKIYNIPVWQYGRKGQYQSGIDLYCQIENNKYIVAQCKNYFNTSYNKLCSQIKTDVEAAKKLSFDIKKFVVMTALNRDTETQNFLIALDNSFDIEVLFWEDIEEMICNNLDLFQKYYPFCFGRSSIPIDSLNEIISAVHELGYEAKNLNENYLNYQVATHYNDDVNLYNHCVSIINAAIFLRNIHDKYYIQLKKEGITKKIDALVSNLPEFYQETEFGTGAEMVYTIINFLNYFQVDEQKNKFLRICDEIIDQIEKIET